MKVFLVALLAVVVFGAVASPASAAQCSLRYATTPSLVAYEDDFAFVHAAASIQSCPLRTQVQIRACVQRDDAGTWTDTGCVTSARTTVSTTKGGRGTAVSFDAPCVTGTLRTHVDLIWGGDGGPTEWASGSVEIACPDE